MGKAEILPFLPHEAEEIEPLVRQADRDEITEALGIPMVDALRECATGACKSSKLVVGGEVVVVFGDTVHSLHGRIGVPWMIGTVNIEKHRREFLQACRPEIDEMLTRHSVLINYVDARNVTAIRWLRWLGFEFGPAEPYGPLGMMFQPFRMWSKPCA